MRIISPFHDYYDTAMGWGHDPDLTYVRKTSIESAVLEKAPWRGTNRWGRGGTGAFQLELSFLKDQDARKICYKNGISLPVLEEGFIVAAGKATPVWFETSGKTTHQMQREADKATPRDEHMDFDVHGHVDVMALASEAYKRFAKAHPRLVTKRWSIINPSAGVFEHIPDRFDQRERLYDGDTWDNEALGVWHTRRLRSYHAAREAFLERSFDELHIDCEAPLLFLGAGARTSDGSFSTRIVRNPCLRNFHWGKAVDPYTLFQSLDQFLGGVMPRGGMPMVEISDKDKIVQKGFDPRYGFRHRPG